jgi:hypothetical protein
MCNKFNSMNKKILSLVDTDLSGLFGQISANERRASLELREAHRIIAADQLRLGAAVDSFKDANLKKKLLEVLMSLTPSQLLDLASWIAKNEAFPLIAIGGSVYALLRTNGQRIQMLFTVLKENVGDMMDVLHKAREIVDAEPLKINLQERLASWDRAKLDQFAQELLAATSLTSFDLPGSTYESVELDSDRVLRIIDVLGVDFDALASSLVLLNLSNMELDKQMGPDEARAYRIFEAARV